MQPHVLTGIEELPREYQIKLVTSAIFTAVYRLWILLLEKVKRSKENGRYERYLTDYLKICKASQAMNIPKLSGKFTHIYRGEKQNHTKQKNNNNKKHTTKLLVLACLPEAKYSQIYILWKSSWPFSSLVLSWKNLSINSIHHYIWKVMFQLAPCQNHSSNRKILKKKSQMVPGLLGILCHAEDVLVYDRNKNEHDEFWDTFNKLALLWMRLTEKRNR